MYDSDEMYAGHNRPVWSNWRAQRIMPGALVRVREGIGISEDASYGLVIERDEDNVVVVWSGQCLYMRRICDVHIENIRLISWLIG